jgi:phosphoserine phosphatase
MHKKYGFDIIFLYGHSRRLLKMQTDTITIIWDFDGTILPLKPFDSEQSLLTYRMAQGNQSFGWFKKGWAKAIIFADRHEWFRKTFKKSYIRMLKGTPSSALDFVSRNLSQKISEQDRNVVRQLKANGYDMMVLSCGTADLSERVLKFAGLSDCFSRIEGNRFQFDEDRIVGMQLRLPNPADKLALIKKLNLSPGQTIVVGDGYTDLPLLKWSSIPVVMDRSGRKKKEFASHHFYFISSIAQIMNIIRENVT